MGAKPPPPPKRHGKTVSALTAPAPTIAISKSKTVPTMFVQAPAAKNARAQQRAADSSYTYEYYDSAGVTSETSQTSKEMVQLSPRSRARQALGEVV